MGSLDLGAPLASVINGFSYPGALFFALDASGNAQQTFTLPPLPAGQLIGLQGAIGQPTGAPCPLVLTAAFGISIL